MQTSSVSAIAPQATLAVAQYLHGDARRDLVVTEAQREGAAHRVELTGFAVKVAEANLQRHSTVQAQSGKALKQLGSTHPGAVDVLA